MTYTHSKTVAAMLALALVAAPLAACGGQSTQGGDTDDTTTSQTAAIDVSSWKTLGDALAYDTGESNSAGWDEEHYVTVFGAGDTVVRVVAKMNAEAYEGLDALDITQEDYDEKFLEVMGGLELESAEDLADQMLGQDELDAYVGKTGQDLVNDGFAFESYWMYGGEETGATMAKGYLAYDVTFGVTVADDQTEDEGAAVMGATIVSVEYAGASMDATDPSML